MKVAVKVLDRIEDILGQRKAPLRRGATLAVRKAAIVTQVHLRGQTLPVLRRGISNAWRVANFPANRESLRPAALVYTNAPAIIDANNRGARITAKGGRYLAIPTNFNRLAGRRRSLGEGRGQTANVRITPQEMVRSRLAFTRPRPAGGLYWMIRVALAQAKGKRGRIRTLFFAGGIAQVGTGRGKGRKAVQERLAQTLAVPMFTLIPQAQLRKTIDLESSRQVAERELRTGLVSELGQLQR